MNINGKARRMAPLRFTERSEHGRARRRPTTAGRAPAAPAAGRTAASGGAGVAKSRNFSGISQVGIHVPDLEAA
jgi:hypothetical protein